MEREIDEKRRHSAEKLSAAESRPRTHDRRSPEAPAGVGAIFEQAAYERERDDCLSRRRGLVGQIREIKVQADKHDAWAKTFDVGVPIAKAMTETVPEAFKLFAAEDQQAREQQAQAQTVSTDGCTSVIKRSADVMLGKCQLIGGVDGYLD